MQQVIDLIDANNYLRRRIEDDRTGLAPRSVANWINARKGQDQVFFIWDGQWANERRREKYPKYKVHRTPATDDMYATLRFFREQILPLTQAVSIRVPRYEADDVIATMAIGFIGSGKKVHIISNDADLKQLEVPDLCTSDAKLKEGVECSTIRLFKTWVGDPSDKITGVKLFGLKSWAEADKKQLATITRSILEGTCDFDALPFSTSIKNWLRNNVEEFKNVWDITGLYMVDQKLIIDNMTVGTPDLHKQHELLSKYML
jgi:hypothetical protein